MKISNRQLFNLWENLQLNPLTLWVKDSYKEIQGSAA